MAIIQDARTNLLHAIGESDISLLSLGLQARLVQELNGVCQWIYANSPAKWWAEGENGDTILAPVTLTSMTVTAASKSVSGSGLTARMNGCTVVVSGQTTQNRIFQTGASTWQFLVPHDGSSASDATITVYHDCVNIENAAVQIIRPVMLRGLWELTPIDNAAGLMLPAWCRYPSHNPVPQGAYPVSGWDRQVATPVQYLVDNFQLYGGNYVTMIRLNPMPDKSYQLSWFQKDTFTAIASFADTRTVLIPKSYESSVLYPLLYEAIMDLPGFQLDPKMVLMKADKARAVLAALSDTNQPLDVFVNATERNSW